MRDDERKRLIELAEKARGTELYEEIHDQLYDSERSLSIIVELQISDPLMELSSVNGKGDMVASEVANELSPEWFSRYQGASWWVTKYRGYRMGYARKDGWRKTEEPFPPPAESVDPHEGHHIRAIVEDRTWHDLNHDGTVGEAREIISCDVIRRFCVTCDKDLEIP